MFPIDMTIRNGKYMTFLEREDEAKLYIEKHLFSVEVSERLFEVIESDRFIGLCNDCIETLTVLRKLRERLVHEHK
jgi:hypothetical protein